MANLLPGSLWAGSGEPRPRNLTGGDMEFSYYHDAALSFRF